MNSASHVLDSNGYTNLKNAPDPNAQDVIQSIEAILANMPARQKEFTSSEDKAHGNLDRPQPGFIAGLDLMAHSAGSIINTMLAPLIWVLRNSLLSATVGFVCGPPGVGKSTFLLFLAASIATGLRWFGNHLVPWDEGKVLAIFCEEDVRILWRRVQRVYLAFKASYPSETGPMDFTSKFNANNFAENIFTVPAAGKDMRLIEIGLGGKPEPSQAYYELLEKAKSIKGLKLIILDPLSRLYGQNENDNSMATYFGNPPLFRRSEK